MKNKFYIILRDKRLQRHRYEQQIKRTGTDGSPKFQIDESLDKTSPNNFIQ